MPTPNASIRCPACGEDTLLKRVPNYDGFKKVGETLSCASCGHMFAAEAEVPFKQRARPQVFAADDGPRVLSVFRDDEKGRACLHCKHYVVNPFTQRCGKHNRVVEATDVCGDFESKG